MQPGQRIVNIARFPTRQDRVTDRHKELKRRLLAQDRLGIDRRKSPNRDAISWGASAMPDF